MVLHLRQKVDSSHRNTRPWQHWLLGFPPIRLICLTKTWWWLNYDPLLLFVCGKSSTVKASALTNNDIKRLVNAIISLRSRPTQSSWGGWSLFIIHDRQCISLPTSVYILANAYIEKTVKTKVKTDGSKMRGKELRWISATLNLNRSGYGVCIKTKHNRYL